MLANLFKSPHAALSIQMRLFYYIRFFVLSPEYQKSTVDGFCIADRKCSSRQPKTDELSRAVLVTEGVIHKTKHVMVESLSTDQLLFWGRLSARA